MKRTTSGTTHGADENQIVRRDFLRLGLLTGLGALYLPKYLMAQDCNRTTTDPLGPFYVANPPERTVLAAGDEPGDRFFISGRVFADDCVNPLGGVIVDVWHANDEGCYSILENCRPTSFPFNLRGQMLTDANGGYSYESVRPGWYLNGALFRPSHIHYRVVFPDEGITLISQLYFEGDPYIPQDPWASDPNAAERIIPLVQEADGFHGVFDVKLDASVSGASDEKDLLPEMFTLYQNYPNPFNGQTRISYALPQAETVRLDVYDASGKEIALPENCRKSAGYHHVNWDGRGRWGSIAGSGTYFFRLTVESEAGRFSQVKSMLLMK